jgi:uncharacterized integral membrane protein
VDPPAARNTGPLKSFRSFVLVLLVLVANLTAPNAAKFTVRFHPRESSMPVAVVILRSASIHARQQ